MIKQQFKTKEQAKEFIKQVKTDYKFKVSLIKFCFRSGFWLVVFKSKF